jgi:hypothetical protein
MVEGDRNGLFRELERYDPLAFLMDRPFGVFDVDHLRCRYYHQADDLLDLVRRVEEGAPAPLRQTVVVDYDKIDNDVKEQLAEIGAPEGIGPVEVLRRDIVRGMEAEGEWGVTVDVHELVEYGDDTEEGEGGVH